MRTIPGWVLLAVLAALPAHADVTIRYKSEIKPGSALPAAMAQETAIRMKGNKGSSSVGDKALMIVDFAKREITLLDAGQRKFVTMPAAQYLETLNTAIPAMPGDFGGIKPKIESRKTGRSELIQGIAAEEAEVTLTMEIQPGAAVRMVMQSWTPKPAEALRVQAIRELTGFNMWQNYFMNPMSALGPMAAIFGDLGKDPAVKLRTHVRMYMPDAIPGALPGEPSMEMTQEVVELSQAALDDSLFQVPQGYQAASFEEVMGAMLPGKHSKPSPAAEAPRPARHGSVQAYVPHLSPLKCPRPDAQGAQGMVHLLVTIDPEGKVAAAEALTGPEPLRQLSLGAVKKWTFRPVIRDGQAVSALTDVMLNFFEYRKGGPLPMPNIADEMAFTERLSELKSDYPRTPKQVLADLEQDSGGRDEARRSYTLNELAEAALEAGEIEKAATYAKEELELAAKEPSERSDAIHLGNTILGLIALRHDDVAQARQHLLESGRVSGSPVLGSFGPTMTLAKALLEKGEREAVLQYLSLCRNFWKTGANQMDAWEKTLQAGGTPNFGMSLR